MKYRVNEKFFEEWTPAMAWVLGVAVADGSISSAYMLKFSMKDKDILEKIQVAMDSNYPIRKYYYRSSWDNKKKSIYELTICRKKIVDDLFKLGVKPKKSKFIKFPDIPRRYLAHFIRGVFDGDGNVNTTVERGYKRVRPRIFTGSLKFARGIKKKLVSLGMPTNIQPHHGVWSVHISNKLWGWMYNDKGIFFGNRKYRLVEGEPIR